MSAAYFRPERPTAPGGMGRFAVLLAALATTAAGCSQGEGFNNAGLAPVSGYVSLDGEPAAGVSMFFSPRDTTPGTGGYAISGPQGQFEVMHRTNSAGILPGTYHVTFSRLALPDGSPLPQGQDAADVGAVESLPARYQDPAVETTISVVTVTPDGSTFNFDLTSK
ncbi:hypothetical protein [Maioricimonas sp. JC845]|uniref:hypothetical protein n=1 Tax=Maioricimonas sp. JC845 TaxID=3232138 RepID=UPI003458C5F9